MKTNLDRLQRHVSQIALTALLTHPSSAASVLTYFHAAASAALAYAPGHALPAPMPAPEAYYLLLFSPSPSALARACALLAKLKRLLERGRPAAVAAAWDGAARARTADAVSLNSFLMDTCNLLWRSRAFGGDAGAGAGVARNCLVPAATVAELLRWLPRAGGASSGIAHALPAAFGLPAHPLLAALARDAFRELERRRLPPRAVDPGSDERPRLEGPASQRALVALAAEGGVSVDWREYRVWVVGWLAERGLGGVRELVFAAMKDLGGTA
jgi:centromere protein I